MKLGAQRWLKLSVFFSALILTLVFFKPETALASEEHNMRGWAYNVTYGYISFNCLDDNFAGRFPFTFPFPFYIGPCEYSQHGVHLDQNDNFSGEAWNSILGFITFNAPSTPSDDFRALCNNSNTCTAASNCTACYNEADQKVYGYMKVVNTGEWIRLDQPAISPNTQITNYLAPQPGIWSGYTSASFGTISFNCSDDAVCGTNSYYVRIGPLEVRQMTAPNWGEPEACSIGSRGAILRWNRRSGVQTGFQIIVSTQDSMTSGVVLDTGRINNAATQHQLSNLSYDTPYYWFLRLWDSGGFPTPWRQFNTQGTKDWITDNYPRNTQIGNSKTFTTYRHEYPRPYFTWSPEEMIVATTSNSFVSQSLYYPSGNVSAPCAGSACTYLWSTSDLNAQITFPTDASTSIMFTKATNTTVTLRTTDLDSYACSTSTTLNVNYELPLWREIKAAD